MKNALPAALRIMLLALHVWFDRVTVLRNMYQSTKGYLVIQVQAVPVSLQTKDERMAYCKV